MRSFEIWMTAEEQLGSSIDWKVVRVGWSSDNSCQIQTLMNFLPQPVNLLCVLASSPSLVWADPESTCRLTLLKRLVLLHTNWQWEQHKPNLVACNNKCLIESRLELDGWVINIFPKFLLTLIIIMMMRMEVCSWNQIGFQFNCLRLNSHFCFQTKTVNEQEIYLSMISINYCRIADGIGYYSSLG